VAAQRRSKILSVNFVAAIEVRSAGSDFPIFRI
jgi:hypothetical protein